MSAESQDAARWLGPGAQNEGAITALICAPMLERLSWKNWWIAFAFASALTVVMWISAIWLFADGI